ncbi:hypothetical protein LWI28_021105 [Acer negundo]|uniref:Protein kinase domain-containing protein n=1 Tax=Acer negundo TaxID=4023 RepID=A0AAD5NPU9_ACENE|nr:hypothetical protein LWI28_021105 [Acer negundo]
MASKLIFWPQQASGTLGDEELLRFYLIARKLQSSQTQVLLQLRKHLEYPKQLDIWTDHGTDFCYESSSIQVNITCQNNFITELKILGDKSTKVGDFDGFAVVNQTLSENFSVDSFFVTLARLTSLRVLSLVSLGIWGPLPDKIHRLSSLEYLDLGSNFLFGSVPPKISTMVKLQTIKLDDNFFNETLPDQFDSLSNLIFLSLSNNRLKGPFPSSIRRISTLENLILSKNEISGRLPDLSSLSSLNVLDLSGNKLDSNLPALPRGLAMAFLSKNSFSSEIPMHYSLVNQLQHLDLSFNSLTGIPPAALFSLPNISYLNLASNMLSGSLPTHLHCGAKLSFVDISNNRLMGALPSCLSNESDKRVIKFDGNCLSTGAHGQHTESYCLEAVHMKRKEYGSKNVGILVGLIVGMLVIMVLLVVGFLVLCRRYCSRGISEQHLLHKAVKDHSARGFSSDILTNARYISGAVKLASQNLPVCRSFTFEELKEVTNNFDNSSFIGEGSYGKLYKGKLENGTQVAVRCLPSSKKYTNRNLKLRLDLLAKLRHPHLVCLLGHCIDCGGQDNYSVNKVFLIYEYVSNGNFRNHLSENTPGKSLNWSERLAVLIGVAKAVKFLHTGVIPGFFNNRLKTNNILLDEHQIAKLGDYGLSIISEEISNNERKQEDNKSWQMTILEDDVFSFGFMLIEAIVGPSVSARKGAFLRDELALLNSQDGQGKMVNPIVLATSSQESLSIVISIANKCLCTESWSRPSLEDVLWNLQYAAQVQATAENEQRFGNVIL